MHLKSFQSAGEPASRDLDSVHATGARFALRGPARKIAIAGAVIVLLLVATVGITLWRYGVATHLARVALDKQSEVAVAEQGNDYLLERGALLGPDRPLTAAQVAGLHTNELAFRQAIEQRLPAVVGYGGGDIPLQAHLVAENNKLAALGDSIVPLLGTPAAGAPLAVPALLQLIRLAPPEQNRAELAIGS